MEEISLQANGFGGGNPPPDRPASPEEEVKGNGTGQKTGNQFESDNIRSRINRRDDDEKCIVPHDH